MWHFFLDNEAELLLRSTEGGCFPCLRIAAARRDYHEYGKRQSLLSVLRDARERVASDPRDKIYGVLGLSLDEDQTAIVPSHQRSIDVIYKLVARHILVSDPRPLDMLLAICGLFHRDYENLKPFWVPDLYHQVALPDTLHASRQEVPSRLAYDFLWKSPLPGIQISRFDFERRRIPSLLVKLCVIDRLGPVPRIVIERQKLRSLIKTC